MAVGIHSSPSWSALERMFSQPLRAALIALCLSATSVLAAPGLSLSVSGPESVNGVEGLTVTTTLTNTGDETLKLLNDPRGALRSTATDTFSITSDSTGAVPAFSGIKLKYVPEVVAQRNIASSFTILAPGESVDVSHDLAAAYNFTASGEGSYTIEADNLFRYVDEAGKVVPIYADAAAHTSSLRGNLAVARRSNLSKRIAYNGCSSSRQTTLVSAASAAQTYAQGAYDYLNSHTATSTRYVTWFGTWTSSRRSTVLTHFANEVSHAFSGYTYDCTCTESDVYAYVYPDEWGYIYLCGVFWDAPLTGTDSKGGTLVHESSHFTNVGSTQDYAYGQSAAKSLAISSPTRAIANADSHEYFAENNPAQS